MTAPRWTEAERALAKRLLAVERRHGHNELPWLEQGAAEQDRLLRLARYARRVADAAYREGVLDGMDGPREWSQP